MHTYMDEVKETFWEVVFALIFFSSTGALIGSFLVSSILPYLFGVLIGTIVAVLQLRSMLVSLDRVLDLDEKSAIRQTKFSSCVRLFAIMIVMALAAYFSHIINIWGVLLGLFCLKFAALAQPLTNKLASKIINKGR